MVTVSYAESGGIVSVSSTLDSMMNYTHSTVVLISNKEAVGLVCVYTSTCLLISHALCAYVCTVRMHVCTYAKGSVCVKMSNILHFWQSVDLLLFVFLFICYHFESNSQLHTSTLIFEVWA